MSRWTEWRVSRTSAGLGALLLVGALGACDAEPVVPLAPAAPPPFVEGPLVLDILAPDSTITEKVLFPDFTFSYVCTVSLQAKLSGGQRSSAITWRTADIEWHWLEDNRFRNASVWPMDQLEEFWRSPELLTGQTRASVVWEFIGSRPYRLDFAFHYQVQGEDSIRTQNTAVRCVQP